MSNVVDERIELNGQRFHYRDWTGPPQPDGAIVLLHGFTGHARTWDAFAAALSYRYRLLALDQRGHGESDWAPSDRYGTADMVADLEAFVAALGLVRFSLVGLSMGGRVTMAYAGRRPAALASVVIVDMGPELAPGGMRAIRDMVERPDVFDTVDDAFAVARENNPVPPLEHHRQRIRHSLMRTGDGRWTYRYDRALRDPATVRTHPTVEQAWQSVRHIDVPTLVVRGEQSDLFERSVAERMRDELPRGKLVEVVGAGHPVPLDRPDEFLDVVRGFLDENR